MDNFNPEQIRHGNKLRQQAMESPATFATYNGEVNVAPDENLTKSSSVRKAGMLGQRALDLMNDPVAAKTTANWMSLFGQSVPGAQFNQAAMQMAQGMPPGEG